MTTTITRREFVDTLSAGGGSLNVNDLDPALQNSLRDAGIDPGELARVAGADAQIRGEKELGALFDLLDQADTNGSARSFLASKTTGGQEAPTLAGAAYDKLKDEVANRRLAAQSQGIVHLGMRPQSAREVEALKAVTPSTSGGVHAIRAHGADGKVEYGGRTFDLGSPAGLARFRDALVSGPDRVPADRADRFVALLGRQDVNTRDELAQLGLALSQVGSGTLPASRLVVSGHGSGRSVSGDGSGWVSHDTIRDVARLFPEGAGKIEHLAFSSCYSAKSTELDLFRQVFPSLKSFWGYSDKSPLAEGGAPAHLRNWATRTDGEDPSQADPTGRNAASWNKVDGEQKFPALTRYQAEAALTATEGVWGEYQSGRRTLAPGARDADLDRYYQALQNALSARDLPPDRRVELGQRRDEVLRLRHPELYP
jgi:hypothetical protein